MKKRLIGIITFITLIAAIFTGCIPCAFAEKSNREIIRGDFLPLTDII